MRRAGERAVELPICAAVDAILAGRLDIEAALAGLMSRPLKHEGEP
jgi:glycerol-3-phosphate dehydrogenase (NAD(P)+)